jgi:hypothetical protein
LFVINHGANSMQVFGLATDQINDSAAATGVPQMPNSTVIYLCMTAGQWYTENIASGFVSGSGGGFQTFATQTGIVAHAGGGQASATPITAMQAQVSVCATAGDSILLPPAKVGMEVTVVNNGAASWRAIGGAIALPTVAIRRNAFTFDISNRRCPNTAARLSLDYPLRRKA